MDVCVCVRHHSNFSTEDPFKSLPMLHRPTKLLSGGCLVVSGACLVMSDACLVVSSGVNVYRLISVSYTHLTLPTNREV